MKPAPCSKTENGKCLSGACQNHVACRGKGNIRRQQTPPSYDPEDAIIAAIDLGVNADMVAGMFFPEPEPTG